MLRVSIRVPRHLVTFQKQIHLVKGQIPQKAYLAWEAQDWRKFLVGGFTMPPSESHWCLGDGTNAEMERHLASPNIFISPRTDASTQTHRKLYSPSQHLVTVTLSTFRTLSTAHIAFWNWHHHITPTGEAGCWQVSRLAWVSQPVCSGVTIQMHQSNSKVCTLNHYICCLPVDMDKP